MPISFYVHIPFCRRKCYYCDFNSYAGLEHLFKPYVEALLREISYLACLSGPEAGESLYFGGGTPSLLPPELIQVVVEGLRENFGLLPGAEVTLEANPGTVDRAFLEALLDIGVNRLSLGAQSFNSDELALLGRIHSPEEIEKAFKEAREAGFGNVNLDLIYGLPAQSMDSWRITLEKALELEPEHLSLYALTLEEGVPLAQQIASGELPAPDEDLAAEMYCLAEELLEKAGYEHYEISNWAKPGFACWHNIRYWLNLPYLGFGAGAHSFWGSMRWHNVLDPKEYIRILSAPEIAGYPSPVAREVENITLAVEMAETVILGLRLVKEGLSFERFYHRFGVDPRELYGSRIEELVELGLLEIDRERIRLSPRGRLLGNEVFQRFV